MHFGLRLKRSMDCVRNYHLVEVEILKGYGKPLAQHKRKPRLEKKLVLVMSVSAYLISGSNMYRTVFNFIPRYSIMQDLLFLYANFLNVLYF